MDASQSVELVVDTLDARGDGIAHYNNENVFIRAALPGERMRTHLKERTEGGWHGEIVEILQTSPDRAKALCRHFPVCGGCRLQHFNMPSYTARKTEQLRYTLSQAGLNEIPLLSPIVTPPATRRRAQVAARRVKDGVIIGFHEWRSHTLVDMVECAVLTPKITAFIEALRLRAGLWLPQGDGCDVQITSFPDGMDVVLIGGKVLDLDARQNLAELAQELDLAQLSWRKWDRSPLEPIAHRRQLILRYGQTSIPFPPGSFLQATKTGEDALVQFAADKVGKSKNVADLFCGLGAFGLSLPQAEKVTLADFDEPSMNALTNAVKQQSKYKVIRRNLIADPFATAECNNFDAVIFDPPRGGAKKQAEQLAGSKTADIVAISCDPASFARDARILCSGGYKLHALLPVDQFLWSTHMELAAHFSR